MELNLPEALLLLALDDEKGKFISESLRLSYSLGGAILLELSLNQRVEIANNRVKVINPSPLRDPLLNDFLDYIKKASKDKKVNYWVSIFGQRAGKIRKALLARFVEKGILEKREERFLWIFPNNKYPTQNPTAENEVRQHLKAVVLHNETPQERDALLLSLLRVCKLMKEVFGDAAKDKPVKARIEHIVADANIAKSVHKAVQEVEAAIAITTTMNTVAIS